jgi:orotate phosphoribosyltransferase
MGKSIIEDGDPKPLRLRLKNLMQQYALLTQNVVLASGQASTIYVDCRQIYFRGEAQFLLGELFFKKMLELEEHQNNFSACGGMAMGSIPLSIALTAAAFRRGRELPGCAVRKDSKDHGTKASIEGISALMPNDRVLIVEDVVTTGSSAIKAINELRNYGAQVDSLLCIVDREQGGAQNLIQIGVQLYSLFTLKDLAGGIDVDSHD